MGWAGARWSLPTRARTGRLGPWAASNGELLFFFKQKTAYEMDVTGVQTCALPIRSEEHTSELQSHSHLVCRLLLGSEEPSELQSHSHTVCRLLLESTEYVKAY